MHIPIRTTPRPSDLAWSGAGVGVGAALQILLYLLHTRTHLHSWEPAYPYTANLLAFEACRSRHEWHNLKLSLIHTRLNVHIWAQCLQAHPDQSLARYLLKGMTAGFRIGYGWLRERKLACSNLPSASAHPDVVQQTLDKEVASAAETISARRTLPTSTRQQVWCNREETPARKISNHR